MNDLQQQTLWLGATRYYLSHSMFMSTVFCNLLIAEWDNIDSSTKDVLKHEILEAIKKDNDDLLIGGLFRRLGYNCDREDWDRVCKLWSDDK